MDASDSAGRARASSRFTLDLARVRRDAGAFVADSFFRLSAAAGAMHPLARPEAHGLERLRDVPYLGTGHAAHTLDVYRPRERSGPLPIVLYVHGGGFRILSKDTHWVFGLAFARRGFVVFNVGYRLAPRHPFPAAVEDACAAYRWVVENAAAYGGDPSRIVVAGESAGANLATTLTIAATYRREEPYARAIFETGAVPKAVIAACGLLQVSDSARFARPHPLWRLLQDRIDEVGAAYLADAHLHPPQTRLLADPLLVLEREAPERPLPPFFAPCGTWDPVIDDTRRLAAAVTRHGAACEARYYEREPHAFHAFVVRRNARLCWQHTYDFLDRHVPRAQVGPAAAQQAG